MGKVAFELYRLLWLIVKGGDALNDRDVAITVFPTNPGAAPCYRQRLRREAHTAARLAEPYLAMPIDEARALQEFCKTPAATYLRERPGRCHHSAVKTHPPARVPRN